jgi:hypothetical protein
MGDYSKQLRAGASRLASEAAKVLPALGRLSRLVASGPIAGVLRAAPFISVALSVANELPQDPNALKILARAGIKTLFGFVGGTVAAALVSPVAALIGVPTFGIGFVAAEAAAAAAGAYAGSALGERFVDGFLPLSHEPSVVEPAETSETLAAFHDSEHARASETRETLASFAASEHVMTPPSQETSESLSAFHAGEHTPSPASGSTELLPEFHLSEHVTEAPSLAIPEPAPQEPVNDYRDASASAETSDYPTFEFSVPEDVGVAA